MKDDSGIPKRSSIKTGPIQRAGSQESRRKALLELQARKNSYAMGYKLWVRSYRLGVMG